MDAVARQEPRARSRWDWVPAGGGLRHEDWRERHRILTAVLAFSTVALSILSWERDSLDGAWLGTVVLVLLCLGAALTLPPRRLPSMFVAIGLMIVCAGFVTVCNGLPEAHFSFFIAVAALALYRDWFPFGAFLIGTIVDHAVFSATMGGMAYGDSDSMHHPLRWALLHGAAVLIAAAFQVVAWRLTEAQERRAQDNLDDSQGQLRMAFDETSVPTAFITVDGEIVRINRAYSEWLGLPEVLPAGFTVRDLPVTLQSPNTESLFDQLVEAGGAVTVTREFVRHDDGSAMYVDVHSNGLRDQQGNLRLIFVQCVDVTEKFERMTASVG